MSKIILLSKLEFRRNLGRLRQKNTVLAVVMYIFSFIAYAFIGGFIPLFIIAGNLSLMGDEAFDVYFTGARILKLLDFSAIINFIIFILFGFFSLRTVYYNDQDRNTLWPLPISIKEHLASKFLGGMAFDFPLISAMTIAPIVLMMAAHLSVGYFFLYYLTFMIFYLGFSHLGYLLRIAAAKVLPPVALPIWGKSLLYLLIFVLGGGLYYYQIFTEFREIAAFYQRFSGLADGLPIFQNLLTGNFLYLLGAVLFTALILLAFYWVMKSNYFSLSYRFEERSQNKAVAQKDFRPRHPFVAQVLKEIRLYWSVPAVVMNTFFSVFMVLAVAAIAILPMTQELINAYLEFFDFVPRDGLIFLTIFFLASVLNLSTLQFSLEGKAAYVSYTLPLSSLRVIWGKLTAAIVQVLPFLLFTEVVIFVTLKPQGATVILSLLGSVGYLIFINALSLAVDLRFANYDWDDPQKLAKNSKQTLISSLGSLIFTFFLIFVGGALMQYQMVIFMLAMVLLVYGALGVLFLLVRDLKLYHY
ncbi:MAG: hypothetical protein Q4E76_05470 [Tissierellia bacterium]|nr:hypothetical protein [Tissierellia bacterium]